MKNNLDFIARITKSVSRSRGIHADSKIILTELTAHVEGRFGFVCLDRPERARLEIVAAAGLDSANFRRLEIRAQSSVLSDVIREGLRVTIKIGDDGLLDFLFDNRPERRIVSVPLVLSGICIGSIALAFDDYPVAEDKDALKLIDIAGGMISGMLRVGNFEREESRKLIEENSHLKQELKEKYDFSNLIGNSSPMRQVYEQVTQVARSNATVLLRGESGTGKEMIAHAIHYNSLRSKRPFVKVNC
ncbi:MAG: sigma 54-interacting transcriptional regulator, partial [Acidobacteriota bacterium]